MHRKEMLPLLGNLPITVTMNDGSEWRIEEWMQPSLSDFAINVLTRDEADGLLYHYYLPLRTIATVKALPPMT